MTVGRRPRVSPAAALARARSTFADVLRVRERSDEPLEGLGRTARSISSLSAPSAPPEASSRAWPRRYGQLHPRVYRYDLDGHGQIFLSGTPHRNWVSNMARDRSFADTFLRRLRALEEDEAADVDAGEEFTHVSICAGERNLVRIAATPIVFQDLLDDDRLSWAGSFTLPFQPDRIRVSDQGYLFHPSFVCWPLANDAD